MIKTKEDLKDKYLEVNKDNLSRREFKEIYKKLKRLDCKFYKNFTYKKLKSYSENLLIFYAPSPLKEHNNKIGLWNGFGRWGDFSSKTFKKISVKDFLKEEIETSGYLYIDPKEKPESNLTISTTPCPKCGFDWSMEQHIEFDNALQGLAWCYKNPMKEIEVEYKGKILLFRFNGKKLEEKYIKDARLSGIIVSSWSIVEAIYIEDIEKDWKNIKQYKGDKYER